jgi:hypothetical protein
MQKTLARVHAVLTTSRPRWLTLLTPINVLVVMAFTLMFTYVPPRNMAWAALVYAIVAFGASLITARDIFVHVMARALANKPNEFANAMRYGNFCTWLHWHGGEHLTPALKRKASDLTPDERYQLAWHYERYTLSDPREQSKVMPVITGALLFVLLVLVRVLPFKLSQWLIDSIDRKLEKAERNDLFDD